MRLEKKAIIEELRAGLADATFLILADFRGMRARQAEELRRRLAAQKAHYHVVKNTFLRRALDGHRWLRMEATPAAPTGVVYGAGDAVEAAKILGVFQQEQRVLVWKQGWLPGAALRPADIEALIRLPSRPILLGQLVGTVAAPLSRMVGVLNQKVASLLYVLQAVQEKKEKPQ